MSIKHPQAGTEQQVLQQTLNTQTDFRAEPKPFSQHILQGLFDNKNSPLALAFAFFAQHLRPSACLTYQGALFVAPSHLAQRPAQPRFLKSEPGGLCSRTTLPSGPRALRRKDVCAQDTQFQVWSF